MTELGSFLRARRRMMSPEDVGLVNAGPRRTPGLRREEVATLANISVDYYERLEQSRSTRPSPVILQGLERALRLTSEERDYLYRLAGHPAPKSTSDEWQVDRSLTFLLESLTTVPAHVLDQLSTVVSQNRLSASIFGQYVGLPGRDSNMAWRWFTDPAAREMYSPEDHSEIGCVLVAELRDALTRPSVRDDATGFVADLQDASEEFNEYWSGMRVSPFRSARRLLHHPVAGVMDVHCDLVADAPNGLRLLILRPGAGSDTAQRFARL